MNRVAITVLLISAAFSLYTLPAFGQRAEPGNPVLDQGFGEGGELDLEKIEESLSSAKFSDRQRAMRFIGKNRERTADAVQKASQNADPEVSDRANWILQCWQTGTLFDADDGGGVRHVSGSHLGVLLDQGRFSALLFVLEITAVGQRSTQVRKEIARLVSVRFAAYVQTAIESQQLSDFVKLIGLVAETREMALCRLQLLQFMGADLESRGLLPESAKNWPPQQRDETRVLLQYQIGEIEKAIALARTLTNRQILQFCLILESRWDELADDAMIVVKDSEVGSEAAAQAWSRILIAAERSGKQELQREAVDELAKAVFDESDEARGIRWKSLAMHGQLAAAFSILDSHRPHLSADVSLASSRPARAFEVLGYPLELVDTQYAEWVDQALETQRSLRKAKALNLDQMCPEIERLVQLICCLDAIGRDEVAFAIAKKLCLGQSLLLTGNVKSYLLFRISAVTRNEWIEELLLAGDPKTLQSVEKYLLADSLGDCDAAMLAQLTEVVQSLRKSDAFGEQLSIVCQIARGEDVTALSVSDVLESMVANIFKRLDSPQAKNGATVRYSANVYGLLLVHGEYELASIYVQRFAALGQSDALMRLGEEELSMGSMRDAKNWFAKIEQASATAITNIEYQESGKIGDLDVVTAKALVGRLVCSKRVGDRGLTASLQKKLDAVLCSPSLQFRLGIADYLREQGEMSLSMRVYQDLLPVAVFSVDGLGNAYSAVSLYDVVRKYVMTIREEQPAEAARLFDIAVIRMIGSRRYRARAYVTLPSLIQEWFLEAAIREGNDAKVVQSLERILELDPLDISFAEERLPQMREAGMSQLADATLDQIMDSGVQYAQRFSLDAMTCNNVAWVAAKNERRLEDALNLASLAVRAEPESATYRDTLAEVLFLSGRTQEALQIERACLLDDPGQWHLHEQIEKYSKVSEQNAP